MKVGFAHSTWGVSLSGASFCFPFLCWIWHNSVNKYCQSASIEITVQCGENESFSYCWELMKWEGSHGSSSILLVMKVKMVLCFVSALSQGYDHTHSHVTFKLLLWRFLWNFIYIYMLEWIQQVSILILWVREREREIYEDSIRPHQAASCCVIDAMLKILGCHLQLMQKDTDYQDKLWGRSNSVLLSVFISSICLVILFAHMIGILQEECIYILLTSA
jgi:hypothetical protein